MSRGYPPEHFILVDIRAVVMFVQCNKFMHAWLRFSGGRDQVVQKRAAVCSMDMAAEVRAAIVPAHLLAAWEDPPVPPPHDISRDGHEHRGEPVGQLLQTPTRSGVLPVRDLSEAFAGAQSSASRGSESSARRRLRTKTTPKRDPVDAAAEAAVGAGQHRHEHARYHIHTCRRAWCALKSPRKKGLRPKCVSGCTGGQQI